MTKWLLKLFMDRDNVILYREQIVHMEPDVYSRVY